MRYEFLDAIASVDWGYESESISQSVSISHFPPVTIVRCYRIYQTFGLVIERFKIFEFLLKDN